MKNVVLKVGSRGNEVKILQSLLQKFGFDTVVDGIFGPKTEDIVMDFQESRGLPSDGIVGKITWDKLQETSTDVIINDQKYVLTTKNYYDEPQFKKSIVLHHTAGWVVQKRNPKLASMNHFHWWTSTDKHVSTAFSIDYYGNIYQHFDPKHWAYHLGVGKSILDRQSIGIELTNEGGLKKKDNGKFVWFSGKIELPYIRENDEPVYVEGGWRGYDYFAPYSKQQHESTLKLVKYLCDKFNISKNFIDNCNYDPNVLEESFKGIYNHANVRTKGKWDLSPAFPFQWFKENL